MIHTVGPVWQGGNYNEPSLLAQCYQRCLQLAHNNQLASIAFPAISTGVYGYPKKEAAIIAITAMLSYQDRFDLIIACCFSEVDAVLYRRILEENL